MEHSLLIVGANEKNREDKALELAKNNSSQFDTLLLKTQEEAGIESVRAVLANLTRKPFNSVLTTAIIFEAQNLTVETQNLLLKILEEPRETNQIILTAPSEFSLLSTVASRCQKMDLGQSETKSQKDLIGQFSSLSFGQRIEAAENLDINIWENNWREKMLLSLESKDLNQIVSYLRKIHRTKEFLAKNASPKIAKINLILDIPNLS